MAEQQKESPSDTNAPAGKYLEDPRPAKEASNQKSLEKIEKEREEMSLMQRFGYFSVPVAATVGDQAYSRDYDVKHQVVDHKVITEKRGIYTKPGKKGILPEAYLGPIEPYTNDQINELKRMQKEDEENYLKIVKERKEKKAIIQFKYPGPQEVIGFYKDESYVPDKPLYKEKDKFRFIKDRRVITENRGIFTNPTTLGTNLIPNDYFSFYKSDKDIQDIIQKRIEEEKNQKEKEREARKVYKKPFSPASLRKCDCFSSDAETYGIDQEVFKQRLQEYKDMKKIGRPKYQWTLPPGSVKHDKPFSPPKLISTGRDTLFNDDLYKMPQLKEEKKDTMTIREKRELENKNRRVPFTYNKLVKSANFAPCISSFSCNLRKDFPSISFH